MSPIATDGLACSVGCDHELSKISGGNHNAVQDVHLHVGPRKHVLEWDQAPCESRGDFEGEKGPTHDMPDMSSGHCNQSDSAGGRPVRCRC